MRKVFLGGTCNESTWREEIIPMLRNERLSYFNPVVDDWDDEAQKREVRERQSCDVVFYTITPKMTGVYSVAEVVDDSNKRPHRTIFVLLKVDKTLEFNEGQWKSLLAVAEMVKRNGAQVFYGLRSAVDYIK